MKTSGPVQKNFDNDNKILTKQIREKPVENHFEESVNGVVWRIWLKIVSTISFATERSAEKQNSYNNHVNDVLILVRAMNFIFLIDLPQ